MHMQVKYVLHATSITCKTLFDLSIWDILFQRCLIGLNPFISGICNLVKYNLRSNRVSNFQIGQAQSRFEITSMITGTPWIVWDRVQLLINRVYKVLN